MLQLGVDVFENLRTRTLGSRGDDAVGLNELFEVGIVRLCIHVQNEGQRHVVEHVELVQLCGGQKVLEEVVLRRDLVVVFKVVHHLPLCIRQLLEPDASRLRLPLEMKGGVVVRHLFPEVETLFETAADDLGVVAIVDSELKEKMLANTQ